MFLAHIPMKTAFISNQFLTPTSAFSTHLSQSFHFSIKNRTQQICRIRTWDFSIFHPQAVCVNHLTTTIALHWHLVGRENFFAGTQVNGLKVLTGSPREGKDTLIRGYELHYSSHTQELIAHPKKVKTEIEGNVTGIIV